MNKQICHLCYKPEKSTIEYKAIQDNELYELSLSWLNKIMGDVLSPDQQASAIKYLMPSGLYAKDAHPKLMKSKIYNPKKVIYIKNGVPLYPTYYTNSPRFQNHLYKALYLYSTPIQEIDDPRIPPPFYMDKKIFIKRIGEKVSDEDFKSFFNILTMINNRPDAITFEDFLMSYRVKNTEKAPLKDQKINVPDTEVFRNMGYRKASIADVYVKRGTGIITINSLSFYEYFKNPLNRETILAPFFEINDHNFDIDANVIGGGLSGQAHAIRMAVSLGLVKFNSSWYEILDKVKYLTRDFRVVERKKYGRHKARKRYTWVAR